MSQPTSAKRGAPSATFGHAGYRITVEMIKPRIMANGQPENAPDTKEIWPSIYRRINPKPKGTKANQRTIVTGYFAFATFRVTGWRHPIEFYTCTTIFSEPITIQRITVGTDESLGILAYEVQGQGQISLDGLPLGKLLAASIKACAFTAYAKPHRDFVAFMGRQRKVNMDGAPAFMVWRGAVDPLEFVSIGGQPAAIKRDTKQLAGSIEIEAIHRADNAPMNSALALRRIATLYRDAVMFGKEHRGYQTIAKWIEQQTNGKRKANTVQQMIAMARAAGYLERSKPRRAPKERKAIKK